MTVVKTASTKPDNVKKRANNTAAAASEIDDLFASRKSASASAAAGPSHGVIAAMTEPPKKRKKIDSAAVNASTTITRDSQSATKNKTTTTTPLRNNEPETIVDTSHKLESYKVPAISAVTSKKRKASGLDEGSTGGGGGPSGPVMGGLTDDEFMDSRGASRRRTDDGLPIYDISELRIGLGGDTELCPFDCECCF